MKAKRTFSIDDRAKDFEINFFFSLFSHTTLSTALILAVTRSLTTFELHIIS